VNNRFSNNLNRANLMMPGMVLLLAGKKFKKWNDRNGLNAIFPKLGKAWGEISVSLIVTPFRLDQVRANILNYPPRLKRKCMKYQP